MKLLVFTSLYPNSAQPQHGVFVQTRLRQYLARHPGSASVVAPVPAAPPVGPARWTRFRQIPAREELAGLPVSHPRFFAPPGFGDRFRAGFMARGCRKALVEQALAFQPDLLDVHYAFPDGVAAATLAEDLSDALGRRLPMVLTCRGTDLNLVPQIPRLAGQVRRALQRADHVVTVAEALRSVALELGLAPERVTTFRNGVDIEHFTPGARSAARDRLGLPTEARCFLAVGHLIPRKGVLELLEAFARVHHGCVEPVQLIYVGDGELAAALVERARELGVDHMLRMVGAVPHAELADWYRAADCFVLASLREGWPNVVLEALACGTPVVATRVWGTPEILDGCAAAALVEPGVDGLASGLAASERLDARAARPWAERYTWDATSDGLHALYTRLVDEAR
ncbi:MAG: glycosyl transferase family 1 [Planctomycetota bacterium]|nr:MAG: glycosyl transferase family 1 [Planctomycetota bacterium]